MINSPRYSHSAEGPLAARKRRHRSQSSESSPDQHVSMSPTASIRPPYFQNTAISNSAGASTSSRSGSGEDTLTVRRREANRLAAQRFRSRKKGYQDSLEEKVRILEDERDVLLRRLGETPVPILAGRDELDGNARSMWNSATSPSARIAPRDQSFSSQSDSPERREGLADGELRVASLESANRRLRDEMRSLVEENGRMRDELEDWQRWERTMREELPRSPAREFERQLSFSRARPSLDLVDHAKYPSESSPLAYSAPPINNSPYPALHRAQSYHASSNYHSQSPGIRLPPLRLPPISATHLSDTRPSLTPNILPEPSLARAVLLDGPSTRMAPFLGHGHDGTDGDDDGPVDGHINSLMDYDERR